MNDVTYEDTECTYLETDPRFEGMHDDVTLFLSPTELRIQASTGDTIVWPIKSISRLETGVVNMSGGTNFDIYGVRFFVNDPEGIMADGFRIAIGCRNDYYADVLAKRLAAATDLSPLKTEESTLRERPADINDVPF